MYKGQWNNGLCHGLGMKRNKNNTTYYGMWNKNKASGEGALVD